MSTRRKIPYALLSLLVVVAFVYVTPLWGFRKNVANQKFCALILTTAGAAHTTGTTNVYAAHNDATSQDTWGTATHYANGQWCIVPTDSYTNHNQLHVLWVNATTTVPVHQTITAVGYDETSSPLAVNVTHINSTAQSGGRVDANITHINGTAQTGGRVYSDVTHVNSTAQSDGRVNANITHVNGTAQTDGRVNANLTHANGTAVTADNALIGVKVNSIATDAVDANALDTDAVTEINDAIDTRHGTGPYGR